MSQIVIDNQKFEYELGCRILKMKHKDVPIKGLEDVWEGLEPLTFEEIARNIPNIEQRRIAILYLGMEAIREQINPILVDRETIVKHTQWLNADGLTEFHSFEDTYELYKVSKEVWSANAEQTWRGRNIEDAYFVKMKDTSTEREYFIWVDADGVRRTNRDYSRLDSFEREIGAIESVAWSFTTDVSEENIDAIIRQGDCILVKMKNVKHRFFRERHLTANEYRTLLVAES